MLLLAGAVVLAAFIGLARRFGTGTAAETASRPFTAGTIALVVVGAVGAAIGDRVDGEAGLVILQVGLALIAVGAAAGARIRAGFVLIAAGVAANFAVITADGGMPVRGLAPGTEAAQHHHGVSTRDHLIGLSDEIRIANGSYSPGDVAVAAGAAVAILSAIPRRRTVSHRAAPQITPTRP